MTTETITLHGLCRDHNLPKTTVRRWLISEGFTTSDGLTPAAVEAAISHFCPAPVDAPSEPTEVASTVVTSFEAGNHRGQLSLASQPAHVDLAGYRGDDAALTTFEPEDIDRFLDSCDGFLEAVDADYSYQKAVTEQKEATAAKVRAKVEQVKTASLLYQVRSESLSLHNRALDTDIQDGVSTLKKHQAAG